MRLRVHTMHAEMALMFLGFVQEAERCTIMSWLLHRSSGSKLCLCTYYDEERTVTSVISRFRVLTTLLRSLG